MPSSTALLHSLGLNEGQIRAAEKILQEAGVPPEQQASKIIEIARKFGELGSSIKSLSGTDPFYKKVSDAIEGGDLKLAEELLNERVEKSRNEAKRAQDEMKRISEQLEENKKEQMKLKDNRGQ